MIKNATFVSEKPARVRDRIVLKVEDLSDADMEAIEKAKVPDCYAVLDSDMGIAKDIAISNG